MGWRDLDMAEWRKGLEDFRAGAEAWRSRGGRKRERAPRFAPFLVDNQQHQPLRKFQHQQQDQQHQQSESQQPQQQQQQQQQIRSQQQPSSDIIPHVSLSGGELSVIPMDMVFPHVEGEVEVVGIYGLPIDSGLQIQTVEWQGKDALVWSPSPSDITYFRDTFKTGDNKITIKSQLPMGGGIISSTVFVVIN